MKCEIKDVFECVGAVATMLTIIVMFWAVLGIYGISEGSDDLCTQSFKNAVEFIARKVVGQ